MKKSAEQLGREARDRNTNIDLNPFTEISEYRADNWAWGWIQRDGELQRKSGMTPTQWARYCARTLK